MWILNRCAMVSLIAVAGCAHSPLGGPSRDALFDRAGVSILTSSLSRQHTYMKMRGATERFCRGPGMDAVNTASEQSGVQIPLQGISAGLSEGRTAGALDLGGRNPAVLIARELMYRACELASNTNADPVTERQIYTQFLQAITAISKAQTGAGSAALASDPTPPAVVPTQPSDPTQSSIPTQPSAPTSSANPTAAPDFSKMVPNK